MGLRDILSAVESAFMPSADGKWSVAGEGMVATAFPEATKAGLAMLASQGNAVDAACAAAFALGVCEPQASGLGGESKAIVHFGGETIVVDGSSRAPALVSPPPADARDLRVGYRGTTVPSTPAFLAHLHRRFGRLPWGEILAPSIAIARNGYVMTSLQARLQAREQDAFLLVPSRSGARYFLRNGREPYRPGDCFRQNDLATLLEDLADFGADYFYRGTPARRIDEDMKANGGFLRASDLAMIPRPAEKKPLRGRYRGMDVCTIPPSSGGKTLLRALSFLDAHSPSRLAQDPAERGRILAETFRRALSFRRADMTAPPSNGVGETDADVHRPGHTVPAATSGTSEAAPCFASPTGETTHLSVMDGRGNTVGITQSINMVYGGKAAAEGLGFLYNNYLIDMNRDDAGHPHYLRPGAPSVSWAAPTILMIEGRPWLVTGSPGSDRIFSTVTQFLTNVLDRRLPIDEAMKEPRLHGFIDGRIALEASRFPPEVVKALRDAGYILEETEPWSFFLGAIHAVVRRATGPGFQGVAEIRRDGTAWGPP